MKRDRTAPPPKKAPTLIGSVLSSITAFVFWLVISLFFSILTEWIGMATIWKEQGHRHAANTLEQDMRYLDHRVAQRGSGAAKYISDKTEALNDWVRIHTKNLDWSRGINEFLNTAAKELTPATKRRSTYQEYLQAAPYVVQSFFVRLAMVVLSLPVFAVCVLVGMVDGLVERDLRRWGGGRESSLTYNLARKSVFPSFASACVLYISLPVSIHPLWLMGPFALVVGVFSRVAFERLKKYF